MTVRKPRRTLVLSALAALTLALAACGTGTAPGADAPGTGSSPAAWAIPCPAPSAPPARPDPKLAVDLPCLGGGAPQPLAATGLPTVVNLWASWCEPCRDELPVINDFAREHAGQAAVLGVDTQDTETAARSIVEDYHLSYPSRSDPDGRLLALLGKRTLPATVFVAADGSVAYVYSGRALTADALAALAREHLGIG